MILVTDRSDRRRVGKFAFAWFSTVAAPGGRLRHPVDVEALVVERGDRGPGGRGHGPHDGARETGAMGIDDVQKTSGNTMAITMTADWVREVDALAQPDFARANAAANRRRVAAEPVPPEVRRRYRVSALLREVTPDLPLVNAARVLAQRDASYHIDNSSRALNADFLEVVYRMASGRLPEEDEFLLSGGQGELSLDGVGLKLSRASLAWSVARPDAGPGGTLAVAVCWFGVLVRCAGCGRQRLLFQREADLHRHLPLDHFAVVNAAARFHHFEPAHLPDRLRRVFDGVFHRLLQGTGGRTGNFDLLVYSIRHVAFSLAWT